jgi:putative DNA primase/helicase
MNFVPDPSWPSIVELAIEVWGQPNKAASTRDDIRFGAKGSKSVKPSKNIWTDHEPGGGQGGYIDLWKLARPNEKLPNGNGKHHGPKPWEDIKETYPYPNADGTPCFEVIRTKSGKPRFRQRRPLGGDRWEWKIKDAIPPDQRPPYRLPQLIAAAPGSRVFIPEGEKDVNSLVARSALASCNSGGAGKWHPALNPYFRGLEAIVLSDNDPQATDKDGKPLFHPNGAPRLPGQDHAADVAQNLHGIAAAVKVLMLPGLPPKGDVSWWLEHGGTLEELNRLADAAPLFQPSTDPSFDPFGDPVPGGDEPPPDWEEHHPTVEDAPATDAAITEQLVMRLFVARYAETIRFNHDSGQWLIWHEHYWRPDLRRLAFCWALDLCRARSTTATVQKIRFSSAVEQGARTMREVSTAQVDWDNDPWLLGTPKGVVDLRTGELRPGRPTDMITKVTAVGPADAPDCPRWLAFLDYAFDGNEQNVFFLQRYFGYCLTGLVVEEFFVFLFGDEGTGKGTTTTTVRGILGDYSDVVPIEMFTSQDWRPVEYYRARLPGKRLIIASEPARDTYWSEAFVNEITGGDQLSGRHPAGRPFDFMPTHKPLLHGNHLPRLKGAATGLKRRLGILPFNHPPETPDRGLKAALRAEWPAILRWMIEGCLAWQKRGIDPPEAVILANAAYFTAEDTLARWIEDCCILDPNLQLEPSVLRRSFNEWARAADEETMSERDFSQAIGRFKGWRLTQLKSNGKRWIRGLGLKPKTDPRWEHDQ